VEELTPLACLSILQKIPSDEISLLQMGKSVQPADLILTHMIVPPPCIRPTVIVGPSKTNEDDLSIKILEIIHTNNLLHKA